VKDRLRALIEYRLKEAEESIKEARVLQREGMSNRAVMNRLYYAMFYAVLALLEKKQLGTSKHTGAISLFDREFVKKGIFDKEFSKTLHRVFELRQKGDYMEEVEVSDEDIKEMFPRVIHFVEKIKEYFDQK
jgi:uncharacterized protein (UPF0332 family)